MLWAAPSLLASKERRRWSSLSSSSIPKVQSAPPTLASKHSQVSPGCWVLIRKSGLHLSAYLADRWFSVAVPPVSASWRVLTFPSAALEVLSFPDRERTPCRLVSMKWHAFASCSSSRFPFGCSLRTGDATGKHPTNLADHAGEMEEARPLLADN